MIHLSRLRVLLERRDGSGRPVSFNCKYIKKSTGEIIVISNAVVTSSYNMGTVNVMLLDSGQIRKLVLPLIIEFNGKQVYM